MLIFAEQTELRAAVARVLIAIGYIVEVASSQKAARELITKEKFRSAIVAYNSLGFDLKLLKELRHQVSNLIIVVKNETAGKQLAASVPGARLCLLEPLEPLSNRGAKNRGAD